jgi:hypothetical protein
LSSQTTDTIRILLGTNSIEFDVPHFLAAMFLLYFIHFNFANPGFLPKFIQAKRISHRVDKFSDLRTFVYKGSLAINGILSQFFRISGGDSENNTRSPGAAQVGPEERAIVSLGAPA